MSEQSIYLPTGGALPGIPGIQNAGAYLMDVEARTIRKDDTITQQQQLAQDNAQPTTETTDTPAPQA